MRLILGELGEAGGGAPLADGNAAYSRRGPPTSTSGVGNLAPAVAPDLDILEYCLNDDVGDQLPGEPRSPHLNTARGPGTSTGGDQPVLTGSLLYQCRPFACRFCAKRFKRKDHLVEHERTHTGERPYVCSICGKSFAKKTNLNTHTRSHHQQQQQQYCHHLHAS
ncbi:Zinc finger protein 793-like [Homarus americanus]|uniref:Zinc finger protein 793-like n=2 Tax=Homarus americanus TaxID=6706 RepID=A0A8J5MV03_HOMAM|nr:Zinc finger protein 793-like [Homarus americanus]